MSGKYYATVSAPFGAVVLRMQDDKLVALDFVYEHRDEQCGDHPLLRELAQQLRDYFSGDRLKLNAPLELHGTEFQQRVWQALQQIPVGEVCTYGQLARMLGSSPRAVGGACRANPVPLFVPCHRVVSAAGFGGFAGATGGPRLAAKKMLLKHEGVVLG